ncbi:MAG: hypothetical protein EON51_00200 [Acinetobacter sp.]|nr:MAG: hypothetical protein EON51_00200 [Acinetobacter sp.]
MLNKISISVVLLMACAAHAELVGLDNGELLDVTGQGGADLSWTLSLNHRYANDLSIKNISDQQGVYYTYDCASDVQCRFAFSPNNHADAAGNQRWLVFKQIQGTIQVDKFSLAGSTIINKDMMPQTALKLSFFDDNPLKIRNLGFSSLSVETDDANSKGYLKDIKYNQYNAYTLDAQGTKVNNNIDVPAFDKGAEKGFMGLNVHGNLHMSGDLKIFSYNCAGTGTSRC